MKKILVVVLLILLTPTFTVEAPKTKSINSVKKVKRAQFLPAYLKLRTFEGNYANEKNDLGKETYGGVTRKYNGDWYGWRYIDEYKKKNGKPKRNTYIEKAEFWVMDYYLDIWVKEEYYRIEKQNVANYIIDFRINAYHGPKTIKKVLISMGQKLELNNKIDSSTIDAINRVNSKQFLNKLKKARTQHYIDIVNRKPNQKDWLKHWLVRTNDVVHD